MPQRPRSRPSALVRADHHEAPAHLAAGERALLAEALRRGEDLREEVEAKVSAYGRWILGAVFKDDAAAALDAKTKNPVWLELVRRAGGPSLRISRRMLYVSVVVAAHDKRISDQAWRGLDVGRKELLLPLASESTLREAAQHVSKFNLTQAKTKEYVTSLLGAGGRVRQNRLTPGLLESRVRALRQSVGSPLALRRVRSFVPELDADARDKVLREIDRLRGTLDELAKTLRGR